MNNFTSKLWDWVLKRSPQNAANPCVLPDPIKDMDNTNTSNGTIPIETYQETESVFGGPFKIGFEEGTLQGPDDQLIRVHNKLSMPIGCGHIVSQLQSIDHQDHHIRGIAGICFYCQEELFKSLSRNEITEFDFQRLSLVCTDCAKITISGKLCCPKHYTEVINQDGKQTYLSLEDIEKEKQQNSVRMALNTFVLLFCKDNQDALPNQEPNND